LIAPSKSLLYQIDATSISLGEIPGRNIGWKNPFYPVKLQQQILDFDFDGF